MQPSPHWYHPVAFPNHPTTETVKSPASNDTVNTCPLSIRWQRASCSTLICWDNSKICTFRSWTSFADSLCSCMAFSVSWAALHHKGWLEMLHGWWSWAVREQKSQEWSLSRSPCRQHRSRHACLLTPFPNKMPSLLPGLHRRFNPKGSYAVELLTMMTDSVQSASLQYEQEVTDIPVAKIATFLQLTRCWIRSRCSDLWFSYVFLTDISPDTSHCVW